MSAGLMIQDGGSVFRDTDSVSAGRTMQGAGSVFQDTGSVSVYGVIQGAGEEYGIQTVVWVMRGRCHRTELLG